MKVIQDNNIPAYTDWVDIAGDPIAEDATHYENRKRKIESSAYFPVAGEVDVTDMANFIRIAGVCGKDYLWIQLRIQEELDAKAGVDVTSRWGNCTDSEKDDVIYYNQMKDQGSDVEDALKRAYLVASSTYPTVTTDTEADAYLKTNQAESAERAKIAIYPRVQGPKLTNYIIDFLNPTDQMTLFNKTNALLIAYRDFVMTGTIVPGNPDAIWDYINGTYLGGLVNEPFTTINGRPLTDLRDLLDDLLFGNNEMTL